MVLPVTFGGQVMFYRKQIPLRLVDGLNLGFLY